MMEASHQFVSLCGPTNVLHVVTIVRDEPSEELVSSHLNPCTEGDVVFVAGHPPGVDTGLSAVEGEVDVGVTGISVVTVMAELTSGGVV